MAQVYQDVRLELEAADFDNATWEPTRQAYGLLHLLRYKFAMSGASEIPKPPELAHLKFAAVERLPGKGKQVRDKEKSIKDKARKKAAGAAAEKASDPVAAATSMAAAIALDAAVAAAASTARDDAGPANGAAAAGAAAAVAAATGHDTAGSTNCAATHSYAQASNAAAAHGYPQASTAVAHGYPQASNAAAQGYPQASKGLASAVASVPLPTRSTALAPSAASPNGFLEEVPHMRRPYAWWRVRTAAGRATVRADVSLTSQELGHLEPGSWLQQEGPALMFTDGQAHGLIRMPIVWAGSQSAWVTADARAVHGPQMLEPAPRWSYIAQGEGLIRQGVALDSREVARIAHWEEVEQTGSQVRLPLGVVRMPVSTLSLRHGGRDLMDAWRELKIGWVTVDASEAGGPVLFARR